MVVVSTRLGVKMKDEEIRAAFAKQPSDEAATYIKERLKFEIFLNSVAKDLTSWNGRCSIGLWQFSSHEINNIDMLWKGWLARSKEEINKGE